MKKKTILNLVRYHVEKNDQAFADEVADIAREFEKNGDDATADYLMELISSSDFYVPQSFTAYDHLKYLRKESYSNNPLILPEVIQEDVLGIIRAIKNDSGLSKFLFYGVPGSGKTESVYQIARLTERDLLSVSLEQLVDSHLGETSKNVVTLFDEINHLPYNRVIILFDELDSLVLDRVNHNDLREMGRVTSVFLKELDKLNSHVPIIATTNLYQDLDKALIRRFDADISFDRYSRNDLIEIADILLENELKKAKDLRKDIRLFNKILNHLKVIPYPGDLKRIIRTSVAFSDRSREYDYLRKIYFSFDENSNATDIHELKEQGYTTREIEILTRIPKSNVSRQLRGENG